MRAELQETEEELEGIKIKHQKVEALIGEERDKINRLKGDKVAHETFER